MKTHIKSEIIESSIGIMEEIFSHSSRIMDILPNASEMYEERVDYLKNIVGDNGVYQFSPMVTKDLANDYKNIFNNRIGNKYENKVNTRWYNLLSEHLYGYITTENLLKNTVPKTILEWIARVQDSEGELKGYNSPKLSKTLTKLYGEDSDIVKWYTNYCPKTLEAGKSDKYIVTLSILPHHIAGMSYFSPRNHGERGWIDGWEGSSCMDTKLNGGGEAIIRLVPNVSDSFLAVAYLSDKDDYDLDNPKYLSRVLVRAVKTDSGDWIMLGCRAYNISNETKEVLLEGLCNEFDNFVSVYNLRDNHSRGKRVKFINDCKVRINVNVDMECGRCDGAGDYDDEDCGRCSGTGKINKDVDISPYIDDSDFIDFEGNGKINISLPESYLLEKGFINDNDSELLEVGA